MSYQALYRTWRPERFADMVGQDRIITTLTNQVAGDRVAHAYLFCGSRGTGKTTTAKVLARAINCLAPEGGDPCGRCNACLQLAHENNLDIIEIDAASNNGVDEIRDLRDKVKYPPTIGRYKVYIIDEVHMLSTGAFNALLKTLEEPPAHAVFILATTEPQRLPATILSRCQRFDFKRIAASVMEEYMRSILAATGMQAQDQALALIARAAEGGMRDALSTLDMCLSYGQSPLSAELVREVLGASDRRFLFDFAAALLGRDAGQALRAIAALIRDGRDPAVFAREVVSHMRALLLAKTCAEDLADLLEVTDEDARQMIAQSDTASQEKLMRVMDLFMQAENDMKWASQPRSVLELCAVRACHPEREQSLAAALERIGELERALQSGVVAAPAAQVPSAGGAKPAKPAEPAPAKSAQPAAPPAADAEAFRAATKALVKRDTKMVVIAKCMNLVSTTQEAALIAFAPGKDVYWDMLIKADKRAAFEECLSKAFGRPMTVQLAGAPEARKQAPDSSGKQTLEKVYTVFERDKIELSDEMEGEE